MTKTKFKTLHLLYIVFVHCLWQRQHLKLDIKAVQNLKRFATLDHDGKLLRTHN